VAVFRDWIPALAGMGCFALGAGLIGVYGFFAKHLAQEFDVGLATINIGPAALLLVPGLVGPVVGKFVDRIPIRRIMLTGATIAMVSLYLASRSSTLTLAAMCFLGFALGLAMYGPVVVNGLLIKLYSGREARALAIAAMGISVATILLPPLVGVLLFHFEWRDVLAMLAMGAGFLLWLIIVLGIPARAGLVEKVSVATNDKSHLYSNRSFWLVGLCVALALNVSIVLAISYPLHFINIGFSIAQAGLFISVAGLAGLCGKGVLAVFADIVSRHTKAVAFGLIVGQALSLVLLLFADSVATTFAVMCIAGFCSGAFIPMHPYLNSRYFGADIIGEVNGAQMPLFLPFGLIGAPLAGYLYDLQGNYVAVFWGLAAVLILAGILALVLPKANPVS
jgi:predicted MFS family arabinose efflux permease